MDNAIAGYFCKIPRNEWKEWFGGKFWVVSKHHYDQRQRWDEGTRLDLPAGFQQLCEGVYSWNGTVAAGEAALQSAGYVYKSFRN